MTEIIKPMTDEEIADIFITNDTVLDETDENRQLWLKSIREHGDTVKAIADQAQRNAVAQVVEWGEQRCPHIEQNDSGYGWTYRHQCDKCWQELKAYAEGKQED